MASSCQPHDLESGPERIPGFGDPTQSSSAETSSSPVRSAGSTVVVSSTSEDHAPPWNNDETDYENMFAEDAGQALLLAFRTGKGEEEIAMLVPVYRPSKEWARSMEAGEKNLGKLPFAIPKKENWDVERWRQFRWLYSGEKEVDIWKRIRQQYIAQRPWWHSLCPFWRPVLLGEREASALRENNIFFG